ncbi:LLM class F420-dependent oxidoreductase [Catellatospora aurea]|uniref:LLM class F420-dependent oxidoreductase n=1 Tax=Catellatospora aurea TaxID=1337874 RepID=A0ABW2H1T4_9ACTN
MSRHDRWGRIGVWSGAWTEALRSGGGALSGEFTDAAAELDDLGYGTLWLGGGPAVTYARPLLEATSRMTIATGILSIWEHDPVEVAAQRAELERAFPGRFVLGLGVSHSRLTERYAHPYTAMTEYLSALDAAAEPVPVRDRVLAALGPRMLALARDRAAGAHPYLVTPEHTAQAREILGTAAVLAPEFKAVLDTDAARAMAAARGHLALYLQLPNYTNNLLRLGFTEDDLRAGGSDRLLDAVFAMGDETAIARRAAAYLDAGADHLAVQVVTAEPGLPREQWRLLAAALPLEA